MESVHFQRFHWKACENKTTTSAIAHEKIEYPSLLVHLHKQSVSVDEERMKSNANEQAYSRCMAYLYSLAIRFCSHTSATFRLQYDSLFLLEHLFFIECSCRLLAPHIPHSTRHDLLFWFINFDLFHFEQFHACTEQRLYMFVCLCAAPTHLKHFKYKRKIK